MSPNFPSAIQEAKDIANMTDLEKKHVPMIHVAGTPKAGEPIEVTVWVGEQLTHPSEAEHHIEFIDLYFDDMFIARCDLTWGYTQSKCCFNVVLDRSGTLRAFERCNLHGDWTYNMEISL